MAPASSKAGAAGSKHSKLGTILLDDSDSDSDGGAQVEEPAGFKVNEEYARRFEHNKKREEQHRRDVGGARKKKRKRSKGKGAAPAEDA
ncbi:hypothetical protein OCS_03333 [Ophiocordyceps sinensis CO18]|uniref:Uncharacterized protein n=1 Tax=Ophiocordyceps sinensis (strain Co18 / CGMCC 3.14243) TaxID=911162 RepID=T5AGS6_OPHSC|nr:hypothetical protein OCS_03333 [Ophiocordyceps sinensis CO18]